jgi:hypothetical protein
MKTFAQHAASFVIIGGILIAMAIAGGIEGAF